MIYDGENPVLRIVRVENLHWTEGYFEVEPRYYSALAFRIKGSATISYRDQKHFINPNDILYLPQGLGYTASYTDTETLTIHFITEKPDQNIEVYTLDNSEELYKLLMQAYSLWKNKGMGHMVYIQSLLYKIFGRLYENDRSSTLPANFLNAVSYINQNFRDNTLQIHTVCSATNICETTFRQLFKKHYKKTPVDYITDLRLEYARNLISCNTPIEAAAYNSGFNDPKYFARVVKKRLGCRPRDLKLYE